ncbi:MAG: hypothetical protein OXH00_21510 [Candidatus Poribacteria bacterium]|nr:hypothetical protein [Candidatus Poribacteria bacterium]
MAKTLSLENIAKILNDQQEVVGIIDDYIQIRQLDAHIKLNYYDNYADMVMQHLFVNIRNSYQDGIFISQGLIDNTAYMSTALAHAQRTAQEFLIDLAYIMRDRKNKKGHEYLRYLKFVVDKEDMELNKKNLPEDIYNKMFDSNLKPKSPSQWSHTDPKAKFKQGLEFYEIEPPEFADYRHDFHSLLSSYAHGNFNTTSMLKRTPEENLFKLRADLTLSIGFFNVLLESALKCYVQLYLARRSDYKKLMDSISQRLAWKTKDWAETRRKLRLSPQPK